jgi:hypothetical protein
MGIAVVIARAVRPGGGISGGRRADQVNVRAREQFPGSNRPTFPIRPGETPSRPPRQQIAYTLNSRQVVSHTPALFVGSGKTRARDPLASGVPFSGGWTPQGARIPANRRPPNTYGEQLVAALEASSGVNYSDYYPQVPR